MCSLCGLPRDPGVLSGSRVMRVVFVVHSASPYLLLERAGGPPNREKANPRTVPALSASRLYTAHLVALGVLPRPGRGLRTHGRVFRLVPSPQSRTVVTNYAACKKNEPPTRRFALEEGVGY